MSEPSPTRPVPGPPTPGPAAGRAAGREAPEEAAPEEVAPEEAAPEEAATGAVDVGRGLEAPAAFAELEQLPVAEHVAVFEAEHTRLQDELSTIDQV